MTGMHPDCRRIEDALTRPERLSAVEQGLIDVHLRRCESCRALAESLAIIEAGPGEIAELDEDRQQRIYDRLVPAIHEVADQLGAPHRPLWARPALAWAVGLSAAAVIVTLGALRIAPDAYHERQAAAGASSKDGARPAAIEGTVDRCEGAVRVNRAPAGREARFSAVEGRIVEVDKGGRFAFHLGDGARMALFGEAVWRLTRADGSFVGVSLERGRLAVSFEGGRGRNLEVATPDAVVRVVGTVFTVEVIPGGGTRVGVEGGRVEVVSAAGPVRTVEVGAGEMVRLPGDGPAEALTDDVRALTAELDPLTEAGLDGTRLVRFDGTPEQVKVEVEGRVLGTTPLTVRLPEGPLAYRLTAPGMEPLDGTLDGRSDFEVASFALEPVRDYEPAVVRSEDAADGSRRVHGPGAASRKGSAGGRFDLFERARLAMAAGDIPYAIGLLERAVPDAEGARLTTGLSLLAECYAATGRYAEAADTFDRIATATPASSAGQNARYEVGRLAMDRLGDLSRARASFTAYVASPLGGDLKEEAYYSLCELDGRAGAHRDALHCFNEFLRAFPGGHHEPDARLWRGALAQDVERRWVDAERDLLAFIKAKPQHPRSEEARYRVALGRYQVGDKRGALRMIDEYLREHPDGQFRVRAERLKRAILDPNYSWDMESK
ncbi:MAG: FecR domain-containing protein [Deltaproteobacteria bacterium]|nr:FecR domain-containing protein [Deltaproteobacteria bacterium]